MPGTPARTTSSCSGDAGTAGNSIAHGTGVRSANVAPAAHVRNGSESGHSSGCPRRPGQDLELIFAIAACGGLVSGCADASPESPTCCRVDAGAAGQQLGTFAFDQYLIASAMRRWRIGGAACVLDPAGVMQPVRRVTLSDRRQALYRSVTACRSECPLVESGIMDGALRDGPPEGDLLPLAEVVSGR